MAKKTGTVKKKVVKVGALGNVYVHSTFNNVIITITNEVGDVISWSSAGKMGFRGSKKNTPYAAQTASADCAKVAYDMGLRNRQGHTLCLEENASGRNRRHEAFGITLTLTHTYLGGLLRDGFIGEDADPQLSLTLHVTRNGLTLSLIHI